MKVIAFQNEKGGVSVVRPVYALARPGEDIAAFLARVAAGAVPAGVPWQVLEDSDFPASREFRNAWEIKGGRVECNLAKAREIRAAHLKGENETAPASVLTALEAAKTLDEIRAVK